MTLIWTHGISQYFMASLGVANFWWSKTMKPLQNATKDDEHSRKTD